jgi:hypothetical protein
MRMMLTNTFLLYRILNVIWLYELNPLKPLYYLKCLKPGLCLKQSVSPKTLYIPKTPYTLQNSLPTGKRVHLLHTKNTKYRN